MGWIELDYRFILAPVLAAIAFRAVAEYLLLTRENPLVIASAKAAIPFAVAFYIVLITAQIQM